MDLKNYYEVLNEANLKNARLVVVSKNQSNKDILSLYEAGQKIFGENKVQDLIQKKMELPSDIEWHMIGSLQKNKVKHIIPWIKLIHSVDSFSLAQKINSEANKHSISIPILLEIKISKDPAKHGFKENALINSLEQDAWDQLTNIQINGLMAMASFTEKTEQIQNEFKDVQAMFNTLKVKYFKNHNFKECSIGMSADYQLALSEGSTIIRVGSKIFNS